MVFSNFYRRNEKVKNLILTDGSKLYEQYVVNQLNVDRDASVFSTYRNNIAHSVRILDEGKIYENNETGKLEGFILVRNSLFQRESEILILCGATVKLIFKLLQKFVRSSTLNCQANIISYVTDNEELKEVYLELGFVIEKVLGKTFSAEPDLVLMRFNNEGDEGDERYSGMI